MDINLPGISGIEALKILREDPATAHIPVVALSANAMPRDIETGLEAGFFRYLTKPIKVNEFMDTLNAALALAEEVSHQQYVVPSSCCDLELLVAEADDVVGREGLDAVAAELAGGADDDDADQKTPPIFLIVFSIVAEQRHPLDVVVARMERSVGPPCCWIILTHVLDGFLDADQRLHAELGLDALAADAVRAGLVRRVVDLDLDLA